MTLFAFPVTQSATEIAKIFCRKSDSIWFDSARNGHPQNKYSYILFNPQEKEGGASEKIDGLPPFQGGWAGYWSYDGKEYLQYYDELFSFDLSREKAWYLCHAISQEAADSKFKKVEQELCSSYEWHGNSKVSHWQSDFTKEEYKSSIQKIINHILEGDIFQANLTRKIWADAPTDFDPLEHYFKLRKTNPAPYAAYMNFDGLQILSTSPESFLSVSAKGDVTTRPIKGTSSNKSELEASEKDRAENVMIVDLLRNDLSKVCEDNSVSVTDLCRIEEFKGLFHLVSEICGKLKSDKTAKDLMKASFPGGSITGAPKEKAMEIIAQTERSPRGVYCGSLGWIGNDGAMETNITIRTVFHDGQKIWFHVGGGITTLSDPQKEYEETELKAHAIKKSFEI